MKLRVLIADDERLSLQRLRQFLQSEATIEIVGECVTGTQAVDLIREKSPDLVFLDIKMPELDGFEVIAVLNGARLPWIIFVTAYDQFAVRAFEANAVDYLLKPFNRERFQSALQRARQRLQRGLLDHGDPSLLKLLADARPRSPPLERLTIKSGGRISVVKTSEIDWISAADNYVELHTGHRTHLLRMAIGALGNQLPPGCFVRISRSCLANVERIREMRPKQHGDYLLVLHNGTVLSGTRTYRQNLAGLFIQSR